MAEYTLTYWDTSGNYYTVLGGTVKYGTGTSASKSVCTKSMTVGSNSGVVSTSKKNGSVSVPAQDPDFTTHRYTCAYYVNSNGSAANLVSWDYMTYLKLYCEIWYNEVRYSIFETSVFDTEVVGTLDGLGNFLYNHGNGSVATMYFYLSTTEATTEDEAESLSSKYNVKFSKTGTSGSFSLSTVYIYDDYVNNSTRYGKELGFFYVAHNCIIDWYVFGTGDIVNWNGDPWFFTQEISTASRNIYFQIDDDVTIIGQGFITAYY